MAEAETRLYSITEVSAMVQVPQHVLRLWESQFSTIKPIRGRNGRRAYDSATIKAIYDVHALIHQRGLDLNEAKHRLENGTSQSPSAPADLLSGASASKTDPRLQQILKALERASTALTK